MTIWNHHLHQFNKDGSHGCWVCWKFRETILLRENRIYSIHKQNRRIVEQINAAFCIIYLEVQQGLTKCIYLCLRVCGTWTFEKHRFKEEWNVKHGCVVFSLKYTNISYSHIAMFYFSITESKLSLFMICFKIYLLESVNLCQFELN